MKNKRGFTLVELLVVIGILGVLIAIAVPSSIGISNRIKEKMSKSKAKEIEVAAEMWADDNKSNCAKDFDTLTVEDLVKNGYLKADDGNSVIDPKTNESMNDSNLSALDIDINSICASQNIYSVVSPQDNVQNRNPDGSYTPLDYSEPPKTDTGGSATQPSGLYAIEEDDSEGQSSVSYFYRGQVENNYVSFANKLWRILRINSDGTLRLILENEKISSFFNPIGSKSAYTFENSAACTKENPCIINFNGETFENDARIGKKSWLKNYLENWYKNNLKAYDNNIALEIYCSDTTFDKVESSKTYYKSYQRYLNNTPNLNCSTPIAQDGSPSKDGGVYKSKIGTVSMDELFLAGYSSNYEIDSSYFIYRSYTWYTITPMYYTGSFVNSHIFTARYGQISESLDGNSYYAVPVINLKADTVFEPAGIGTVDKPYVVK